jgi:hypothetical protein
MAIAVPRPCPWWWNGKDRLSLGKTEGHPVVQEPAGPSTVVGAKPNIRIPSKGNRQKTQGPLKGKHLMWSTDQSSSRPAISLSTTGPKVTSRAVSSFRCVHGSQKGAIRSSPCGSHSLSNLKILLYHTKRRAPSPHTRETGRCCCFQRPEEILLQEMVENCNLGGRVNTSHVTYQSVLDTERFEQWIMHTN